MLDLNDFFYFVQVVDRSGFTAAGRMLHIPKWTLSHRIQRLETELGVRLLNRTSRRFAMTDAGQEFYRHAVAMLHDADLAESAIRHRVTEPTGTVRCTAAMATMQFAMCDIVADFLLRYPKVNVVAHATDRNVDIVGENYDVAIRAHSGPLPDSTLVQRALTPAPWLLFAGSAYLDANEAPKRPEVILTIWTNGLYLRLSRSIVQRVSILLSFDVSARMGAGEWQSSRQHSTRTSMLMSPLQLTRKKKLTRCSLIQTSCTGTMMT